MRDFFTYKRSTILLPLVWLLLLFKTASAENFYWAGSTSSAWETLGNWRILSGILYVVPTVLPGQNDNVFIARDASVPVTNQPTVSSVRRCALLTIGANQPVTLTINTSSVLTPFNVMMLFGTPGSPPANQVVPVLTHTITTIGSGFFYVERNLQIGNDDVVFPLLFNGQFRWRLNFQANSQIDGNIILNSVAGSGGNSVNFPEFYQDSGTLTLLGQIITQNQNTYNVTGTTPTNAVRGRFLTDNSEAVSNLVLRNANAIPPIVTGQVIDFTANGTGKSTVTYDSNATQTVYTNGGDPRIGVNNATYDNLRFRGTGLKVVQGGLLSIADSFDNNTNSPCDFTTNRTDLVSYTNTINNPASSRIFNGGSNGVTFSRFTVTVNAAVSSDNPNLNPTSLSPTIITNKINIAADGMLTLSRGSSLTAKTNAADVLTLRSGASSSATVMPIPAGCSITGDVNVERFVKGSPSDLSKRGYRLISSPVFAANISGSRLQSYNYLLNSVFVSGLAGGGFNTPGNPTLYLYREDIAPTGTTFTSGNYKGIARINNTNTYDIGTQRRATITNTADTTTNVPVGNGTLFFFRGNITDNNGSAAGSKLSAPFNFPEDVVLTATGNLTQGTVNFQRWFAKNGENLNTLSYTSSANLNNGTAPRNVRGFNLVGNPYAASIDWNKYNRNSTITNSSIYATTITGAIWFFNPTTKQYDAYTRPSGNPANDTTLTTNGTIYSGTGSATNVIASGQGFFMRAEGTGGVLRFLESAKTIAQPPAASLNTLMGVPVSSVQNQFPYLRIQLKKDSVNNDDILIRFMDDGQEKYDAKEDAEDMGGNGALVALSSFPADKSLKLAISAMPPLARVNRIALSADATSGGLYELNQTELTAVPEVYDVWLKDHFTRDSIDFRQNKSYSFRIDKTDSTTFGDNRFELVFRRKTLPPYELLAFSAERKKEGAALTWRTLNEFTYTDFTIERSDNGNCFVPIGTVKADGNGRYGFTDKRGLGDITTYRILQNIPDGREMYSNQVSVINAPKKLFTISPNPASDFLDVQLEQETKARIQIVDIHGRLIQETSFIGESARISITGLRAGSYIIKMIDDKSFKIIGKEKWIKL